MPLRGSRTVPRVSVVIPTYDRGYTLRGTLKSVFAQTYQDFEVIVVDDGSMDETKAVVRGYGDQVRYLYQEKTGVARARNRGIEAARGKLVASLDSDDVWEPELLEIEVGVLDRFPEVVLVCARSTTDRKASRAFFPFP